MGIVLANMIPERSMELHARGVLFGYRRILAGVHYPSDVEAGKVAAAAIAESLFQDPQFQSDLAGAREELRSALGLKGMDGDDDDKNYGPNNSANESKEQKEY
jgi:acid phosphatase (class A)